MTSSASMLQLDASNNSQRGPVPRGSDINQNATASSIFPSPSLSNGNGLAVSTHSALNGASFMGLSAGPPSTLPASHPPHGALSAGLPQGTGVPSVGSMIHWGTGSPHHLAIQTSTPLQQVGSGLLCSNSNNNNKNNNDNSEDEDDDDYRPFTPPPPRERLSYTRYQLELLNGIYDEVRYPNSTQKQLIAKRVGITREQVKIWFQNRRRKDVVSKGGKPDGKEGDTSSTAGETNSNADVSDHNSNGSACKMDGDDTESGCTADKMTSGIENGTNGNDVNNDGVNGRSSAGIQPKDDCDSSESKDKMVSAVVLKSIIAELQKFNNEYLKQKKNRKKSKSKKHTASLAVAAAAAAAAAASSNSSTSSCKSKRLFQSYDMIAPPNKVTPTAFLNTSANRFKHAGGTSAFQNPRENRLMPIPPFSLGDNRLWDGFGLPNVPSFPGSVEPSDLLQQRSHADPASAIPTIPSSLAQSFSIQNQTQQQQAAAFSGLLSGSMAAVHHLNSQTSIYDNLPVLSDLLNSYKNQQSASAVAAAAAAAHRQQLEHSFLSSTSGSPGRPQPPTQSFFHLPSGAHSSTGSLGSSGSSSVSSSATNNTSDDSSKSPLSDLTFPSPTAPPTHPFSFNSHHHHHHPHPHSSPFALNRVFPFPLIADPPVMLSTIRQSDSTFRTHPPHQWPHPPSSLGQANPSGVGQTFGSSQVSPSTGEDPYRPLFISSLNNPYFSPTPSNNYPSFSPSSLPPPQHNWPSSPPGTDSSDFAQI